MGASCACRRRSQLAHEAQEAVEVQEAAQQQLPPIPSVRPYRPSTVSLTELELCDIRDDPANDAATRAGAEDELDKRTNLARRRHARGSSP